MMRIDPRAEFIIIIGILTAMFGAGIVAVPFALIRFFRETPSLIAGFVGTGAVVLICGVGTARLRRWPAFAVALLSAGCAIVYLTAILRCGQCGFPAFFANVVIALIVALPAAVVLRWRRFLR